MDITEILQGARNPNPQIRKSSEEKIESLMTQNLLGLLIALSEELSNEDKLKENRQLAGTLIKNIITNENIVQIWLNADAEKKNEIKMRILSTLASKERNVRKTVASTIAGICKIELPQGKWPEIVSTLVNTSNHENMDVRLSSLETLGFICEELNSKTILQSDVDQILTAIITNLNHESCDLLIAKFCLNALLNSIVLAEKNFTNKVKKNNFRVTQTLFSHVFSTLVINSSQSQILMIS